VFGGRVGLGEHGLDAGCGAGSKRNHGGKLGAPTGLSIKPMHSLSRNRAEIRFHSLPAIGAGPLLAAVSSTTKQVFSEIHYEMVRKIAEGGMGVVHEAVQLGAGNFQARSWRLKLIREEYSAIEEFQNNFIGEARLVADLIHTNIVQTYHLGLKWAASISWSWSSCGG
jgi:serine/threonine protein kinase